MSKDILDTSDSVFEESDLQWKAAELEQLHDAVVTRVCIKTI